MEAYKQLELEFGKWAGVDNVVACSSGTAALHLALEALRLPLGSQVIVPEFTMIACARAVVLAGLQPVFADCNSRLLIDPDKVDELCSRSAGKVRALMPVHVYGRQCAMEELHTLAMKYGLAVVEDLAEAHGIEPHERTDAACWSFYRNKVVAGEEGGAVSFRSGMAAELARSLRTLGFTDEHDFTHIPRGHNYRLSNVHAEYVLKSLRQVDHNVAERRYLEGLYEEQCPQPWKMPARDVPWIYDIRIPGMDPATQTTVIKKLNDMGIAARHPFKPMSFQEEFSSRKTVNVGHLPRVAAKASMEMLYLPLTPGCVGKPLITKAFEVLLKHAPVEYRPARPSA